MDTLRKIWNIVSTALVVLVVLCAVFLMGTRLLGFECYTVISGSMEPKYSVGDLIYVKPLTEKHKTSIEQSGIKVGDPITFMVNQEGVIATHRVVRIDAEKMLLYTKGDANEIEDAEPVHLKNVVGEPSFFIPKLGYVSDFIQNPPGTYITIGAVILLIILVFVPDMIANRAKPTESSENASAQIEGATSENDDNGQEKISKETEDKKTEYY